MTPRPFSFTLLALASIFPGLLSALGQTVILSEFLLLDDQPWIELHHQGESPLDLAAYQLLDSEEAPGVTLSNLVIQPNDHLVIPLGDGPAMANLNLPAEGGYLALRDPQGTVLTLYHHYPRQRPGISYGTRPSDGARRYFSPPTPGEPNENGLHGFVEDTKFSVDGGFHTQPFTLAITSATPEAEISYTTDGSLPGLFNPATKIYQTPIAISATTVIRARAAKWDYLPTNLDTHTYIFPAQVVDQPAWPPGFPRSWGDGPGVNAPMPAAADYELDPRIARTRYQDRRGEAFTLKDALQSLPSLSMVLPNNSLWHPNHGLHALARNKGRDWERPLSLEYFDSQGKRRFQVEAGLRMQGGWNRFPESLKKSFRLYFRSEYGDAKLKARLFPDSPVERFDTLILRSGNGKTWSSPWRPLTGSTANSLERTTYLRDQLPRDLQRDMRHPTAHGRFVHLYINGLYWGLYNLVERVDEWFGPAYLGGDEEDYDVIKWIRSEGMVISAGNAEAWNRLLALVRSGRVHSPDTYDEITRLVDITNLIDYMLINFTIGNTDWPDNNAYTFRRRHPEGRFRFVCWDSEESLLTPNVSVLGKNNASTPAEIFQRLLDNAEFRLQLMDRIHLHFSPGGRLTDAHLKNRLRERAGEIDRAIVGESARWGDLMRPSQPYTREHWLAELSNLEDHYFGGRGPDHSRQAHTLTQMRQAGWVSSLGTPVMDPPGGFLPAGTSFTLAKPSLFTVGEIYHTTNGEDPRLPGGQPHPLAVAHPGNVTLTLTEPLVIQARLRFHDRWGPLVSGHFTTGVSPTGENLVLSEIMYHPAEPLSPEFLELAHHGTVDIDLSGAYFDEGIRYHFPTNTLLAPGERLVLTEDLSRFGQRYGHAIRVLGPFADGTRLSNAGERLTLRSADGEIIFSVVYDDQPPSHQLTDGGGHSLVRHSETDAWGPSTAPGGSPGSAEDSGLLQGILASTPSLHTDPELVFSAELLGSRFSPERLPLAEISSDLVSWTRLPPPRQSALANDRTLVQWPLSATAEARFVRLRAPLNQ